MKHLVLPIMIVTVSLGIDATMLNGQTNRFWVATRDGELLKVETQQTQINWNKVSRKGDVTSETIDLATIKRLEFTDSPASKRIARIRQLLSQLNDDSYQVRHQAELELLKDGGDFVDVINSAEIIDDPEFKIRYGRIKSSLASKNNKSKHNEFDYCFTRNGTRFEGDSADWKLEFLLDDQKQAWDRSQISVLYAADESGPSADSRSIDNNQLFYQLDQFQKPDHVVIGFEKDRFGKEIDLPSEFDIKTLFSHRGCLFDCEGDEDNSVIISSFNFEGAITNSQSICNYQPNVSRRSKFYGNMRIQFVDPQFPNVPATVNEFGMHLAIVKPRQTIFEAYNADGYRIATVESTQSYSFLAVRSREPIAYIRILPNRAYTPPDDEDLDENYAVDDIVISRPTPSITLGTPKAYAISMKDGQRLLADQIEWKDGKLVLSKSGSTPSSREIQLDLVAAIVTPTELNSNSDQQSLLLGMLADGSVIELKPGRSLSAANFPAVSVSKDELVGYWSQTGNVSYPETDDFKKGKVVVAFPLLRAIGQRFEFVDGPDENFGLTVEKEDAIAIRPPNLSKLENHDDPSELDALDFIDMKSSPCVWFKEPPVIPNSSGLLSLKDGRRFRLGTNSPFSISKIDAGTIELTHSMQSISISLDNVRYLRFPR